MPSLVDLYGAFVPVPTVLRADPRITAAHALTYGALASRLGTAGAGYVSVRNIAERAWRSAAQVRRHLDDLEAWGYLHRKRYAGRPSWYLLDRLVLEQLELDHEANPAHLGEQGSGPNPTHLGEQGRRRDQAGDPARSYAKNPTQAHEQTPKTYKDKTGFDAKTNGERPTDPASLGEVLDDLGPVVLGGKTYDPSNPPAGWAEP